MKKIFAFLIILCFFIGLDQKQVKANQVKTDEFTAVQNRVYKIIQATQDKVATIEVERSLGYRPEYWEKERIGLGSGFLVSKNGEVITNAHVIEGAKKITVKFKDKEFDAKIILENKELDLALLKIEAPGIKNIPFLELDLGIHRAGEFVIAIGSPFGLSSTITMGIISNPLRTPPRGFYSQHEKEKGVQSKIFHFVQTDAAINPGNSGGPLISLTTGKVIGVNTFILGNSSRGLNFAIPTSIVRSFIENKLISVQRNGKIKKEDISDWLKILVQKPDKNTKKIFKIPEELNGLLVSKVKKNSPLKNKVGQGDLIISMNNEKILKPEKFNQKIYLVKPGNKIELKIRKKTGEMIETIVQRPKLK